VYLLALSVVLLTAPARSKDKYQSQGPIHLDGGGEKWAVKTLQKLSLEEKVGQLFMISVRAQFLNVNSPGYLQLRDTIHKYHPGSVLITVLYEPPFLYRNEPFEAADILNRLQSDSPLPLLVAADFERGLPMRLHGGTEFPHAMAFGATGKPEYAEDFGRVTAGESRAIGVQWNFFPVVDVNSNPGNPIINTRSFGEDPRQVSDFADAYIRGAHAGGLLTTAKHFPGHGDTVTDSHLGLAEVTGDRARLNAVELPPFRNAIAAGVDSVMIGHVSAPALDPDPKHVVSTSPAAVNGLLKRDLGFQGIVVTDALDMAALTHLYASDIGRAAVDTFKAGNDVLIIPADLNASYNAMLTAVRSGEITQRQLDEAVLKVLKAKASLGLHRARLVNVNQLTTLVGKPENLALGQHIADDAITLVRENGKILPLKKIGTASPRLPYQPLPEVRNHLVVVILTDDVRTEAGREMERQIRQRVPDVHVIYVDPRSAGAMTDNVLTSVDEAEAVIAAIYVVPTPGKVLRGRNSSTNSVALTDASGALLQAILDHGVQKTVVLAMGDPYLAKDFPGVQNYICAFSNATVSELATVKALFGEIPIHGHLPVSIPNIGQRGFGMERPQIVQGGLLHADQQPSNR
jgi:beta-N-acetylhexosaminidase